MAGPYKTNAKREGAGSALIQIVIVACLVAAGIFFYWRWQNDLKHTADQAREAKEKTQGDDAPQLLEARKKLAEIPQDKLEKSDDILATAAEIEAQLYQAYGVVDAKAKAEHYVQLLKDRNVRKPERYAAEAYVLLGNGKAAEAEALLMDLMNNKGAAHHGKLLHALSVAKLAQGKAKEAVVAAQEGEKLSSNLVRLPIAEGDALLALGNIPSAAAAYLKASKLNPDHVRARTALALTAAVSRQGKPELLLKNLDQLLEEAKQKVGGEPPPRVTGFIQYAKGEIYLSENDAKDALAMAEASSKTDPQPATFALRGRALAKLGKIDDAKKAFDDALALSPSSLPIAKAANDVLARANRAADGIAYLQKVQAANPENGMVYVELSMAQSAAGKAKDALKNADLAIAKLGNAHDLAVFAKGRAQQADGKLDDARKTYGEALPLHPNNDWPELYFAMGELRVQEKIYDEATAMFTKSIELWDKQGASIDTVADAYDAMAKAYEAQGKKKKKEAEEAKQKAEDLRNGKKA